MTAAPLVLLLVFIAGALLGPKQETQVILLSEADGRVGAVEVRTEVGSSLLNEAGQMARVTAADRPPAEPVKLSQEQIEADYAEVLAAEPPRPKKFLLYFEGGSARLTAASQALLPQILSEIRQRKSATIGVYGHSDRVGAAAYNLQLSLERATAVRDLLTAEGVKPALLDIDSHGEGNPLVPTADNVAEPRNRRVEVVVR